MANARAGTVIVCDTTATTYATDIEVVAIKYIGAASGTASIKAGSNGGALLWEESGTSNVHNHVHFRCTDGLYVTLTNSAKIYIYTK